MNEVIFILIAIIALAPVIARAYLGIFRYYLIPRIEKNSPDLYRELFPTVNDNYRKAYVVGAAAYFKSLELHEYILGGRCREVVSSKEQNRYVKVNKIFRISVVASPLLLLGMLAMYVLSRSYNL